ncbi:hypothetical protein PR202_ga24429 [Eleusine coracana subsp. coracana]|uniref:F-box domain-containing protein n=1 Tax=Eleusine coracana subsp. coracana TaxID=191504 RepID=A0AAV5D8U7_ELECO|nr:hypothetical protein PR202_ga24429 [Eleusine coracana subsp. coracana]
MHRRGWLSRLPRGDLDGTSISVPDDALSPVFARLPDAADVVRCAATCRRWSRIVAKDAPGPRLLPPGGRRAEEEASVVIRGGVACWSLGRTVFAVRLHVPEPQELPMPPGGILDLPPGWGSLGVAPDGKLMFIDAAVCDDYLTLGKRVLHCATGDDLCTGTWESHGGCIRLTQLKVRCEGYDKNKVPPRGESIKLRCFCEKSGILFFTLGEGTNSPGTFALNLATEEVHKVADGLECDAWRNFVAYEMDGASYLASISRH